MTSVHPFTGLGAGEFRDILGSDVDHILPHVRSESSLAYHLPEVNGLREALQRASDANRVVLVLDKHASTTERCNVSAPLTSRSMTLTRFLVRKTMFSVEDSVRRQDQIPAAS